MTHWNVTFHPRNFRIEAGLLLICTSFGFLGTAAQANAGEVYTIFDPVGSIDTQASCMNDGGAVAGSYFDSNNVSHGFVRAVDGTITTFDPKGSIGTGVGLAQCVNTKGWITGSFLDSGNVSHGYARSPDGTITTFDPRGSFGTSAYGIDVRGTIAGSYVDSNGVSHGFFRTMKGTITSFDPPDSSWTMASQVNRAGEIAGLYYDANNQSHVFVRTTDGRYVSSTLGVQEILGVMGINDDGTVVGYEFPGIVGSGTSSFEFFADGHYTFVDVYKRRHHPKVPPKDDTYANCINKNGMIAGNFDDRSPELGFTLSADGTTRQFHPVGSTQTFVNGCNDDGDVTGDYLDSSDISHGFVRSR